MPDNQTTVTWHRASRKRPPIGARCIVSFAGLTTPLEAYRIESDEWQSAAGNTLPIDERDVWAYMPVAPRLW